MKKFIILFFFCILITGCKEKKVEVISFIGKNFSEIEKYGKEYQIQLIKEEEYSEQPVGTILTQSPKNGEVPSSIHVVVSKGPDYKNYQVNELGNVPIMMYHGIWNMKNEDTDYTLGNVDKDGYQRTSEAFMSDLEFYYQAGYRMIRLVDFVNGEVHVKLGKSPIILTFDDGKHNIEVTGLDEKGEIIIDPNCAVGILESFKKKYPDYQVTATFFVNGGLFESEYNEKILKWLVENGYDIGNHSMSHSDFSKISREEATTEIGSLYSLLETMIKGKYVPIVALPFGSPYSKEHTNFSSILNSSYQGKSYETIATLRVGWEANCSCFDSHFDPTFLKRIRAYDHDGSEFDIKMNFDILEKTRFISDGDANMITVPKELKDMLGSTNFKVNTY